MANAKIVDLREKFPPNIIKWANLETTANNLLDNFETGHKKNAELINRFFEQPYFRWEESLINKFSEIKPDIKFDDIKNEWINLALLYYKDHLYDLNSCLNKVKNVHIKQAFIQKIFNEIQTKIWWQSLYTDFSNECKVPLTTWTPNVLAYFQKVIKYLEEKQIAQNWKKVFEILKDINITNDYLNSILPIWEQIPSWANLSDPSIPESTKNDFDALLSFEIWKEADRTINICENIAKEFQKLSTNSLPAINTIIWENDKYKFDENILWPEYKWKLETINNNPNLSENEKNKEINDLKREFYIKYLKTKNKKIWNTLEQLYNNDFDYSKIDPHTLKDYFDKVADIRLNMLFDKSTSNGKYMNEIMKLNFWNIDEFKKFYKELTDVDPNNPTLNITLSDVNKPRATPPTWKISIPIQRKIVEWKNLRLKDINLFWKNANKSFDAFPMEYSINKADIDALDITIEDKTKLLYLLSKYDQWDKYEIKWEDIWILIFLFFIINSKLPITEMDPEEQKEVEKLFWQAKNHENWPENEDTEKNDEKNEWNEIESPEKFKEKIEKYWPGKFENWSEIWLPMRESDLPGWWYQWMKIKLSKVNMKKWTFTWTVYGGELKFDSSLEWKSSEFNMNQKFIDHLENIVSKTTAGKDKIWLQPNPDKLDFNSFKDNLGNRLWTSNLSFPVDGVTWDGNKFMHKILDKNGKEKEVEAKYFWGTSDDKSIYEVKYNPSKKSFTVSSKFNWEKKWKDWKSDKKRFFYQRDMDWNNFLIFFTQKWLAPQTEKEANETIARQEHEFKVENGWHWKLNRFSLSNIKNVFKTIKWNIKKKIDDYNKAQDQKLEDILIWDWWLYGGLAKVFWFIPSMKSWLWQLQQEYYNERDNRTWKKIEWYLKIFQSDPDFGTTFEQVPPFAKILWWKSYKDFITNLAKPNISRSQDDIHKAAALLLANIEKWASPYRWLAGEENSGLWVRVLLWDSHHNQFMRDKQKCINDLKKEPKEKDQIQDVLATCEMDYIINNVTWANWKLGYFGSHEWRWIPGKKGTDYIDNPSKRLLSDQFASKLKWSYKWRFNKSSVEESFGKISHNDFNLAKEDFKKLIKSSRFPGAIANLKKMFLLAKTPEQQSEYQKSFLLYMLSGVLDVNGKKDLRKQTYQRAKTMSFLPWMLAKNTWHSDQVAALLNDFDPDFSKKVKSYFHSWNLKNWKLEIGNLIGELDSRRNKDKMKSFEKYSKSVFPSKNFPKNSVLGNLKKDLLKTDIENIDDSLLDNPLVANSGWLLSNINVVRNRMTIREWEFSWKDNDEISNKREFWNKIAEEVKNTPLNIENTKLLLKQYCERFQIYDKEKTYRRIKTAYERKKLIGKIAEFQNEDGSWDNMGRITNKEINSIIWYTFQWTVMSEYFSGHRLPEEMKKALKAFQNKFYEAFDNGILKDPIIVRDVFGIWNEWHIKPQLLWSWEKYNATVTWREYNNDDDDKKEKNRVKRHFISWNFINHDIANLEKRLKNLSSVDYQSVTKGDLDTLYDRYRATW